MNECNYYIGDGPPSRVLPRPRTTAAELRQVDAARPQEALRQACTVARLPADGPRPPGAAHSEDGRRMVYLALLGAETKMPLLDAELSVVTAMLPSAQVRSLQEQISGLTGGEGVLDVSFGGYEPIHGSFPGSAADRRWSAGADGPPWTMPLIREWPQLGAWHRNEASELARLDPLLRYPVILPATFAGSRQPRETNVALRHCRPQFVGHSGRFRRRTRLSRRPSRSG
jgi:hypothetical protein